MLFSLLNVLFVALIPVIFLLFRRRVSGGSVATNKVEVVSDASGKQVSCGGNESKQTHHADGHVYQELKHGEERAEARRCTEVTRNGSLKTRAGSGAPRILIAYATQTQNALTLAHKLFSIINASLQKAAEQAQGRRDHVLPEVKILELREAENACSLETLLEDASYQVVIFMVSTFTGGSAPVRSQSFEALLKDAFEDHRVPRDALSRKRFALFGLGDTAYGEQHFNRFAKNLHEWCMALGAPTFVVPPVYATEARTQSLFHVFCVALLKWLGRVEYQADGTLTVQRKLTNRSTNGNKTSCCGGSASLDGTPACGCSTAEAVAKKIAVDSEEDEEGEDGKGSQKEEEEVDDVEDLVLDDADSADNDPANPPELLYPKLRENLTKQGYHLVGSHSGVKLCRWTKAMLRGRGGCYKHTFYNINSSQCMEMTPSLACANKCVFCWRHHTNPVSRTFRWKQDPPQLLVEQGMEGHRRMIKQMRGVPGVTPERLEDAMNIRHCALSLVGEPIMYPQINEFCDLLHEKHISSFMVTNAQFPEQLRDLTPVVQLYLSIDAPTPEELKRIDRPLFDDYWERCLACVKELHKKKQRTVFRLTLVNQYNNENVSAYADLVQMGWPDFIEVKGVTYCGTSNSSTLRMKENVPWHYEVVSFCKDLCHEMTKRNPSYTTPTMAATELDANDYDSESDVITIPEEERNRPYHIACEHEHSCCVLIALDKFFFNQQWNTWIDYEKFYHLLESGRRDFTSMDYTLPTPAWATFNSKEKGFDPSQTRVLRKRGHPVTITSGC